MWRRHTGSFPWHHRRRRGWRRRWSAMLILPLIISITIILMTQQQQQQLATMQSGDRTSNGAMVLFIHFWTSMKKSILPYREEPCVVAIGMRLLSMSVHGIMAPDLPRPANNVNSRSRIWRDATRSWNRPIPPFLLPFCCSRSISWYLGFVDVDCVGGVCGYYVWNSESLLFEIGVWSEYWIYMYIYMFLYAAAAHCPNLALCCKELFLYAKSFVWEEHYY